MVALHNFCAGTLTFPSRGDCPAPLWNLFASWATAFADMWSDSMPHIFSLICKVWVKTGFHPTVSDNGMSALWLDNHIRDFDLTAECDQLLETFALLAPKCDDKTAIAAAAVPLNWVMAMCLPRAEPSDFGGGFDCLGELVGMVSKRGDRYTIVRPVYPDRMRANGLHMVSSAWLRSAQTLAAALGMPAADTRAGHELVPGWSWLEPDGAERLQTERMLLLSVLCANTGCSATRAAMDKQFPDEVQVASDSDADDSERRAAKTWRKTTGERLKRCGGCRRAGYCSTDCESLRRLDLLPLMCVSCVLIRTQARKRTGRATRKSALG